jgi:hypothetical protein
MKFLLTTSTSGFLCFIMCDAGEKNAIKIIMNIMEKHPVNDVAEHSLLYTFIIPGNI